MKNVDQIVNKTLETSDVYDVVLNNIIRLKEDQKELEQFIETQSSQKETLILCGITAKQLNKPSLVKYVLNKLYKDGEPTEHSLDQMWVEAVNELQQWFAENETTTEQSIIIKNHVKTSKIEASLIVACMDRHEHLIQTLPTWFDIPQIKEYIIVDFNSKIPLSELSLIKEWAKHQKIIIVRVEEENHFNLGKAYNLAADFASCDKLLKIDCDHLCVDSSWITRLDNAVYDSSECYFIRGDWRFGHSMSGLLFCDKKDFVYYREDLNGWGFDDLDLSRRIIETKPRMKEVIWPDASLFIKHLPHNDDERTKNYELANKSKSNISNRLICHQPLASVQRTPYKVFYKTSEFNVKFIPNKSIEHGVCVTLKDNRERWKKINSDIPFIQEFSAIDTRKTPELCLDYNLVVRPSTITYSMYFKGANGAVGCYLSHYLIWEQIVQQKLSHVLVVEDDVDTHSLNKFLNRMPVNIEAYEFIQLNKRFSYVKPEHRVIFHGTESYIVSLEGAKKLIRATQQPKFLEHVYHYDPPNVKLIAKQQKIKQPCKVYEPNSIIAPADKFISMCCDPKSDPEVQLKFLNYPCVDINADCAASDIDGGMGHIWKMSPSQVEAQINKYPLCLDHYL